MYKVSLAKNAGHKNVVAYWTVHEFTLPIDECKEQNTLRILQSWLPQYNIDYVFKFTYLTGDLSCEGEATFILNG